MTSSAVRIVLVEGEDGDGVTVDHDDFHVAPGAGTAAQRVLAAILGTRESAREGGYRLSSTGVTFTSQAEAAALRATLFDHKIENVMLVSAFLAAAALAQAVGSHINHATTGLLFIEPEVATLALVNANDGSIGEIHRRQLSRDDDQAVAEVAAMAAGVDRLTSRPDGLFVVGSGVNVAMIKSELDRVSPVPVSAPEEPEMALARGAALASAHAPLFSTSTRAMAWAQDPGTGIVDPALVSLGLAYVPPADVLPERVDYNATSDHNALAYSAAPDYTDSGYLPALDDAADNAELTDSRLLDFTTALDQRYERKPLLVTGGVAVLFLVGVVGLAVAMAVTIRPTNAHQPDVKANVVTHKAPPPKAAVPPPAPPPSAPPAPAAVEAPPAALAPPPAAPAPPAAPPPPPELPPILQIPGLPGGPPLPPPDRGPWGHGGWGDDDWGGDHGHGHGHGGDGGRGQIPIPLPIPGLHLGVGF